GDIFQTWPTLNALRRNYPEAEIHFLVRDRFQAATEGLRSVDQVLVLPNPEIFEPLFSPHPSVEESLKRVDAFLQNLRAENYDRILNLSFSPASSFLVDAITNLQTEVSGYTRHRDGFLAI